MVTWALAFFALGLPAHSAVEITVRAFYALHDTRTPVAVGIAAMALNVGLSLILIRTFEVLGWLPLGGLALSNSLATTAEMAVLLRIIRGRLHGLEGRQMAASLARAGFAALIMGGTAGTVALLLGGASVWVQTGLAIATGLAVYAGMTLALGAAEPRAVWTMVRYRRSRL
jgi:putative peptidoglycan lipid II flippase